VDECRPLEHGLPLRGPNNWPDEHALAVTFREPMTSYHDAMSCLARRIMPVLAIALGREEQVDPMKHTLISRIDLPYRSPISTSDHTWSLCLKRLCPSA